MSKFIKKLTEQRNALAAKMTATHETAETEERAFTSDEKTQWDGMKGELRSLDERIEMAKGSGDLNPLEVPQEQRTSLPAQQPQAQAPTDGLTADEQYSEAFRSWMGHGVTGVTPEQRTLLQSRFVANDPEQRAQGTTTNAGGGYSIHSSLATKIIAVMKQFGGLEQLATVLTTSTGADMMFPTGDDTGNEGEIITENTQHNEEDATLGQVNIGAFMYSSKMIRVSLQLLQDNQVGMEAYLAGLLGKRLGRVQARHFAIGDNATKPNGILNASTGVVAAASAALSFKDLNKLVHSVDPAYRLSGLGAFCFNDSTLQSLEDLDDDMGRPLWRPSNAEGSPATINGFRYAIDQAYESIGAGKKVATFGDHKAYMIRRVNGVQMMRLAERYAEFLQVGLLGFNRADGELLDTSAVKHLIMA